ncbi:MAG: glycogen debranching enzyme GlgX [Chthoniobacter sp.]|nr:glycogen debranching enzyme GlgX [Chthoniobacter sp.]
MKVTRDPLPGRPYPLGATLTSEGVNFALFSEHAKGVDLCLFQSLDTHETERIVLNEWTQHVWHCFVPGLKAGQLYGYRVHGLYKPAQGARFNPAKLLLDPYAKAISNKLPWREELNGFLVEGDDEASKRDLRDNALMMPKAVVVDEAFDWGADVPPRTPLTQSVIYETHVRGFSKTAEALPEELRGTYAGLGSDWAIHYLRRLGVTAVELLPVHQFRNEPFLESKGLVNYWGYNSIGYFAPHEGYACEGKPGAQVPEFKAMVQKLHAAGIEVLLDVVYNHTAEGDHLGPTLSFRGIDNTAYYRLEPGSRRLYRDYTGCGNTLDTQHPRVLQLIMDSLRYWVTEMHVDGFRFDLASALARETHHFDLRSGFLDVLLQDPILSKVKLIAEPWDLGEGGYRVGGFPVNWSEWNGKYRDCVRGYWRGDAGLIGEFASRLTGSSDLYQRGGRYPEASINFVTAHDGFTLADLVSYNEKHNEANGEGNRDGESHNRSWNCGAEGPTEQIEINTLRRRQRRNFLATLFLSQGVPMLCAGDEYGRTQKGNNNTYCQDNELNWLSWRSEHRSNELEEFVAALAAFRRDHPAFRRTHFFGSPLARGGKGRDLIWLTDRGTEMHEAEWSSAHVKALGMVLVGSGFEEQDPAGGRIRDNTFMLLFNAHHGSVKFVVFGPPDTSWWLLLDTGKEAGFLAERVNIARGDHLELPGFSMVVLQLEGVWTDDLVAVEKPTE